MFLRTRIANGGHSPLVLASLPKRSIRGGEATPSFILQFLEIDLDSVSSRKTEKTNVMQLVSLKNAVETRLAQEPNKFAKVFNAFVKRKKFLKYVKQLSPGARLQSGNSSVAGARALALRLARRD